MIPKKFLPFLFVFCITLIPAGISHADPLANWTTVTSNTNDWFYGMAYGNVSGNNMFITVGYSGTLLTSPDGVAWTLRTSGDTHNLFGVGYGNGRFVAVGRVGTILTSTDGVTWTWRTSGTGDDLYGAAYGNSRFVVVGASGTIRTSSDNGLTWTDPFSGSIPLYDNWLFGLVYGWEFAAVGEYDGTPANSEILTSTDGLAWVQQNSGTTAHLLGVGYGNGRFVAVGAQGVILKSTDGIGWTTVRAPSSSYEDLNGVAFGTVNSVDYFVAVGNLGTILTSPDSDLVTWTPRDSGTAYDLQAVAYDSTYQAFAAVGGYGTILLDGDSLPTNPVKISQPYEVFFGTIQGAYNNATSGDVDSMALHFYENLTFNIDKSVALKGGYNSTFGDNPSYTTLNGSLTISNGTVTIDKIIIQ